MDVFLRPATLNTMVGPEAPAIAAASRSDFAARLTSSATSGRAAMTPREPNRPASPRVGIFRSLPDAISRCTAPNASDAAMRAKKPLDQRDMGRLGILRAGSCYGLVVGALRPSTQIGRFRFGNV